MEDAAGGVEGEILVGCYARGEPAFGGGPFEGEHMVWRSAKSYARPRRFLPVKVLPNTNSLGGTSPLGVVVFVTESFEGSISCSFIVDADFAWML